MTQMVEFLKNNIGTIIVAAVLLCVVVSIIVANIKNKKRGKTSCGCGCSSCSMASICHKKPENK